MAYDPMAFKKGVLLAETFEKVKGGPPDPTGWWISEKLDGVRAYWNGQNFFSRNGLQFDAPAWFKAGLPTDTHLDGELWCGREQFERCVGIIKYQKGSTAEAWRDLIFLGFDAPVVDGCDSLAYEARHEALKAATGACEYAAAVGIRRCTGSEDLDEKLRAVLMHGGEGLMLYIARGPRTVSPFQSVRVASELPALVSVCDQGASLAACTSGGARVRCSR